MKAFALVMLILAALALLLVPSDAPSDASPVGAAIEAPDYIEAPATVSPAVAPPTPPVVVSVGGEDRSNCPGGVCFDLPAKKAQRVQAPQRRVVFRGCGIFGRRCR